MNSAPAYDYTNFHVQGFFCRYAEQWDTLYHLQKPLIHSRIRHDRSPRIPYWNAMVLFKSLMFWRNVTNIAATLTNLQQHTALVSSLVRHLQWYALQQQPFLVRAAQSGFGMSFVT